MRRSPAEWAHAASWWLLVTAVVTMFVLSANTLALLGVPYDIPGGPMPVKLHISTYLVTLAVFFGALGRGNPLHVAAELTRRRPLVVAYLGLMVFVALWSLTLHGSSGAAFFVDTLWVPGLSLIALALHPRARHRQLLVLITALLVLNSLTGVVEAGLGRLFIPVYDPDGKLIPEEHFRAAGLWGVPITSAMKTAVLLPTVFLLPLPMLVRLGVAAVHVLALLAFGGRTALGAALVVYGLAGAVVMFHRTLGWRYSYKEILGGTLLTVFGVGMLAGAVVTTGLGERIFANMTWDNSANVRLVVWNALDHLEVDEWWIGTSAARIDQIKLAIGLDPVYEAIENFWVALFIQLGVLGFVPFVLGLACGFVEAWRIAPSVLRLSMFIFLVVGSGANTLASKTVVLSLLFITCQCGAAWRPAKELTPWPSLLPARFR